MGTRSPGRLPHHHPWLGSVMFKVFLQVFVRFFLAQQKGNTGGLLSNGQQVVVCRGSLKITQVPLKSQTQSDVNIFFIQFISPRTKKTTTQKRHPFLKSFSFGEQNGIPKQFCWIHFTFPVPGLTVLHPKHLKFFLLTAVSAEKIVWVKSDKILVRVR